MKNQHELKKEILHLEGRGYPAYRDLKGQWDFKDYTLSIDHVQSDPFASPSDVSIHIENPGYPAHLYENRTCRIALQDALLRNFACALAAKDNDRSGSGKSGKISVAKTTQEILERSACRVDPTTGSLILRLNIGFPARGRSILASKLVKILFDVLPPIVRHQLIYADMSKSLQDHLQRVYELSMNQQEIRRQLEQRNLAAFVADGAILPRKSGASALPMSEAIPFHSNPENRITLSLPYAGEITGMAIPMGITLIAGGGYHGKSTLLNALEKGVYDHIEGDGREFVITRNDAAKIRGEDGRAVHHEDISAFIQNLPNGKSTTDFVSEDASGSTSQAANVCEAIESGSHLLLIDEDTSATNFMIRDALMNEVISQGEEPIIPFIDRVKELSDKGVSTILVAGSSGAYFRPADLVIQMKDYEPINITQKAKDAAASFELPQRESLPEMKFDSSRIVLKNKVMDQEKVKVKTNGLDSASIAREPIDLRAMEQLIDSQQSAAIGKMILYAQRNLVDNRKTTTQIASELEDLAREKGLSFFGRGSMAMPRRQELLGALDRMRSQQFQLQNDPEKK